MRVAMQILDCDYVMLNGKPLVRLFGKTEQGETVCAFFKNFLPYCYIDSQDTDKIREVLKDYNVSINVEKKIIPIGYNESKQVLKITGKDPGKIPEIKERLKPYGTVYEADILFKYRFMVDYDLWGMSWVEIEGSPAFTKTVKCRAIDADKVRTIEKEGNAPLRYVSFDIECISESDDRMPDFEKDPIIMISMAFYPDFNGKKTTVLISKQCMNGNAIICSDEKQMLEKFSDIIESFDPDIIVGYNINNFDLPYIVKRMEVLGVSSSFGRSSKPSVCRKLQNSYMCSVSGRIIVDPYEIIKRDPWVKFKRYDLGTIAEAMLGKKKIEVGGPKEMKKLWNGDTADLNKFVEYCRVDSELALALVIEKNLIDKFFELSKISGLLLQDSLGGQSQRHECRLLHEFRKRNMLMPCKPEAAELMKYKEEREEAGLKGAIVLEPITGLYKDKCVVVLDFTSLYPSIIRTFNICPSTLLINNKYDVEHFTTPQGVKFVKPEVREGVLPAVLKELMEARAAVKKRMKSSEGDEKRLLNAKQLALKDMANSLYGYTGYLRARLYVMDVANSVTAYGRENILKTQKMVEENFPVRVVYGDTDSIFVETNTSDIEEAEKLGREISEFVSERLPGVLNLKFEKTYKTFLIITKKRYAGWKFEEGENKIEMKGIETVRRDWCSLTGETMMNVLNIILKEGDIIKASKYVREVIKSLSEGKIPLEKLSIVKGITKSLNSYDGVQPHVELAKKINARDATRNITVGERISYVIIKGNQLLSKRAEDPEYVKEKGLEIDSKYYIENQILPPIERIFKACGVDKAELLEGSRQKSLFEVFSSKPAQETILEGFDAVSCIKCKWSFRRIPLVGKCPECGGQLNFEKDGYVGTVVKI